MKLVLLSLVFTEEAVRRHDVASHASNAWMVGVCNALVARSVEVCAIGHEPARVWPLGRRLRPGKTEHLSGLVRQRLVRFLNLPLVRRLSLGLAYRRALCDETGGLEGCVVCSYNPLPWQLFAAQAAAKRGARWISVVLDDETIAGNGWRRYVRRTKLACGHVFVSRWAYENAPVERKFLMEGGIEAWRGAYAIPLSEVPSVMFAGLLCESTGAKELLALADALPEGRVELWICGRGSSPELTAHARRDPRIKLLGFLSETELDERLRSAWVLVNPRSATHGASYMNFPSKVLRYLSYGKPVVTVWTPGIPAEYRDVLQVVDPARCGTAPADVGREMAARVADVLKWSAGERADWSRKLRGFVVPAKLWPEQISRLLSFIDGVATR